METSLLGQGQIGVLQVLLQYITHLGRMLVGNRPRVYSLRNSVPAASFNSISVPLPCLIVVMHNVLAVHCESTPGCSFPNHKFEHICSLYANDPHATDKHHKAVMCPHLSTLSSNGKPLKEKWYSPRFYNRPNPTTDK